MVNDSWIKLFRKFNEWGWYSNPIVKVVFIHFLLNASLEDKEWNGVIIKRGELPVGRKQLSKILGISEQSVRTAITKLKSTSEITSRTYNKFSVITINKFDEYQQSTNKSTNNQPATNQQLTTSKEYKNIRNKEYNTNKEKKSFKKEKKLYNDKWTLEQVGAMVVEAFNLYLGTKFKDTRSFLNGLEYWLETYTPEDIETAISKIKFSFWKGKMTPVIMFRRKNPQGEPVDYISQLLNYSKEK